MISPKIADVRIYLVDSVGDGGDYHRQKGGHWIIDSLIANPMSGYERYKASRTSWGIGVLGSIVVEIEDDRGNIGVSTGFGGPPASWLIDNHQRAERGGRVARRKRNGERSQKNSP